ncbi:MAG: hypothetical protein ACRCZF_23870 [Gemmataceae bacterium]
MKLCELKPGLALSGLEPDRICTVIRAEEAKGHRVVDVSAQKCGWDVSSYPPTAPIQSTSK